LKFFATPSMDTHLRLPQAEQLLLRKNHEYT